MTAKKTTTKKTTTKKAAATKTTKKAATRKPAAKKATKKSVARTPVLQLDAELRYRMISEAAYYLAEQDAFGGDPVSYWLAAEKQLGI
jgi:hypothetical protein